VGTSGECPICKQGPDDIMHLLFQCTPAREMWERLGIVEFIDEAMLADRACSSVLESLLFRRDNIMPGFNSIGLKEVIGVCSWHLW
jgi:hypothetical protein